MKIQKWLQNCNISVNPICLVFLPYILKKAYKILANSLVFTSYRVKEKYLFEDIIGDSIVESQSKSIVNIEFLRTCSDIDGLRRRHLPFSSAE